MLFMDVVSKLFEYLSNIDRSPGTIEVYRKSFVIIRKFLEKRYNGPVYIEDITQDDLETFMRYAKEERQYSPNMRSKLFYALRTLYSFALKREIVNKNIALHMDFIRMPKKERSYLTENEAEMLIDKIPNRLIQLMAIFLFNTGLRISECLNLKMNAVDFEKRTIHVHEGKGGKDRIVPMNDKLFNLLVDYRDNWRESHKSDFFFATKRTGSVSYSYTNATIRSAAKKAGINKNVSCHLLRHSFASALVKRKVGIVEISKLLGHSSLAVTSVYTHTNLDALSEAVNTLN